MPQLDDDGDGLPNSLFDGLRAANYTIGSGVLLAGDDPLVGMVMVNSQLSSDFEQLTAAGVTSTGVIDRLIAVVSQPGGKLVEQLLPAAGEVYTDRSFGLCGPPGEYTIAIYAVDQAGNASLPAIKTANRALACTDFQFFSGFE